MDRRVFLGTAAASALVPTVGRAQDAAPAWVKLPTEPYRGKQDDVVFVDALTGWYGNGAGKLFRTTDGGQTWVKQLDRPGTFVRALGFVDAELGFLGNIGPDYFPNVSDATPLYRTRDGGGSWVFRPRAGITFRLTSTKNTRRNIITSIIGISSMCALRFFGSSQVLIPLPRY